VSGDRGTAAVAAGCDGHLAVSDGRRPGHSPFQVARSVAANNQYKAAQPVSITVRSGPAFVQLAALAINQAGVLQVNFFVPQSTASGTQPGVVTVGKFSSPPVNLVVQ
jgi:uncharacterized protein (TIGR03437 family)